MKDLRSLPELDHAYLPHLVPAWALLPPRIHCSHPGIEEAMARVRCHGGEVSCPLCGGWWQYCVNYGVIYEGAVCEHEITSTEYYWLVDMATKEHLAAGLFPLRTYSPRGKS